MSRFSDTALSEIAPRYSKSEILRMIYDAFDTIVTQLLNEKTRCILECRDIDTMPHWLLQRRLVYWGLISSGDDYTDRQQLKTAIKNLDNRMGIQTILRSYNIYQYHVKDIIVPAGNATKIIIHNIITPDGIAAAPESLTTKLKRMIDRVTPAHKIYILENRGWAEPVYAGIKRNGFEDNYNDYKYQDTDILYHNDSEGE